MNHKESYLFLTKYLKEKNLIKHSLACEAAMRELAKYFQEPEEDWGLAGLLHDIDYEETKNSPERHSLEGAKILKEHSFKEEIIDAVKAHNNIHNIDLKSKMAKALYCLDSLTGLIVAATLVLPSKKIKEITTANILNRFEEKSFARGAKREKISLCESLLGLSLENFINIVLKAMQNISDELSL